MSFIIAHDADLVPRKTVIQKSAGVGQNGKYN